MTKETLWGGCPASNPYSTPFSSRSRLLTFRYATCFVVVVGFRFMGSGAAKDVERR